MAKTLACHDPHRNSINETEEKKIKLEDIYQYDLNNEAQEDVNDPDYVLKTQIDVELKRHVPRITRANIHVANAIIFSIPLAHNNYTMNKEKNKKYKKLT